jgi:methylenetetrahydrofolate reductase (NADPH)
MQYSVQEQIAKRMFHVEILSPKQESLKLETELEAFAEKFRQVIAAGHVVCIPDNPMGNLAFQATDLIRELELPARPGQVSIHINTFHAKKDLDDILQDAIEFQIDHILVISGDGSERLPKLRGTDIGMAVESVTSVELLRYIHREYPGKFHIGVAFNPYEPQHEELEKLERKVAAGAEFITTQPIIEKHPAVESIRKFNIPIVVESWMSKKLHLLSECVGYEIPEDTEYDGMENLRKLLVNYPGCGVYLAILGFKTQFPVLHEVWS